MPRDTEDEIAEMNYHARRARRAHMCQCTSMDMPGTCPGPSNCPLVDNGEPEEAEDTEEDGK